MTSLNTDKLEDIDQSQKDLTSGYLKRIQAEINQNDNPYYNPPSLVVYIIVLYNSICEYFAICGDGMKISDDAETISKHHYGNDTAYGNIGIHGGHNATYIWKFKVLSKQSSAPIAFGIDASNKKYIKGYFCSSFNPFTFYAYRSNRNAFSRGYKCAKNMPRSCYGHGLDMEDIIIMTVNTKSKSISFCHNDKDLGIAYQNIDFSDNKRYHMAVWTNYAATAITLIDFVYQRL